MNIFLRKINGALEATIGATRLSARPGAGGPALAMPLAGISLGFLTLCLVIAGALLAALVFGDHSTAGALLAFPVVAAPARDLQKILAEAKQLQDANEGKTWDPKVREQFEALCAEGEQLQAQAKDRSRLESLERFAAEVPDAVLPGARGAFGAKAADPVNGVVAYATIGAAYVNSPEFKSFAQRNFPKNQIDGFVSFDVKRDGDTMLIPVTREMIERKAVDASGLLTPDRVNRLIEAARPRRPFLRDVVEVLPTNASSIEYPIVAAYTDASAIVLPGGSKPEATITTTSGTATVRDIAVTTPIKEQTLADVPQIQGIIDGRLRGDLRRTEEKEMLWGDGTGLLGIFETPGVGEMTRTPPTEAGTATLIDKVRMCVTDIQLAEGDPNFIAADPLDVERIQLVKGTDNNYVYVVVTDSATGQMRIWGLTMIPTTAMRAPGTTERRLLVGDGNGATLWDRNQINTAIGWVNDQFKRNERTIRLEERVAFAAWMPFLFRYLVTEEAA